MNTKKLALTSALALSLLLGSTAAYAQSGPAVNVKKQSIPMVKLVTAGSPGTLVSTTANGQTHLETISGKVLEVSDTAIRFEDSSQMTYSLPLALFANQKDLLALGLEKGDAIKVKNEIPLTVSAVMIRLPEMALKGSSEDFVLAEDVTLSTGSIPAQVAFTVTASPINMKLTDLPLPFASAVEAGGKTVVLKRAQQ